MSQQTHKFLFSVIMPVYNVEDYLDEAIQGILQQSIGFKKNVELILVDDGGTDSSLEICKKYKEQYPENIKIIQQANQGPAVARDTGAAAAEGKYLSLPDSDDILSKNTLKRVYRFFENHYDEVDVVTIPWEYFEARTGRNHPLNGKFYSTRVVDLEKDYTEVAGSVAPSFFKAEVFKRHKSHPEVGKYSEDLRYMGEILLEKKKIGLVREATYYYRKRMAQTSSQDGNTQDKFFYLQTPKTAVESLVKYAKKKNKTLPKFIQFMVMYDLQWRMKSSEVGPLDKKELKEYKSILLRLLKQVDDDVVVSVWNVHPEHLIYFLDLKHGFKRREVRQKNSILYYNDLVLHKAYRGGSSLHVDFIEVEDKNVRVEVKYTGLADNSKITALISGKRYTPKKVQRKPRNMKIFMDQSVQLPQQGLVFTIPKAALLKRGAKLQFFSNVMQQPLNVGTGRFTGLSPKNRNTYVIKNRVLIKKKRKALQFKKSNVMRAVVAELRYAVTLLTRISLRPIPHPLGVKWSILPEQQPTSRARRIFYTATRVVLYVPMAIQHSVKHGVKNSISTYVMPLVNQAYANIYIALFRALYFVTRPYFKRKNIWIFMDRVFEADDSAEILYEYTVKNGGSGITPIFTIKADAKDFTRLQKIGKVVPFLSQYHKLLQLHSKKVISSHADDVMINPFQASLADMNDLYKYDFIFLQHGIIKDDISDWLNRYSKNIKLFVTSVRTEYQSLLDYDYFYDKSVVKLTGLPRYDRMHNNPEKKVALCPTWRNHLAMTVSDADRGYSKDFKKTYYYRYYQDLISNARLNKSLKKYGYTMQFYIHPSFKDQYVDFKPGDSVEVKKLPYDYKQVKSMSSLMITDYSSVVFDFAYLRKPIIYSQFDEGIFWSSHISKPGYFSYRQNGLGPVMTNLDDTVDQIIKYLENGCELERKYRKRIDNFFAFDDKNNTKRVFKEIVRQDRVQK